MEELSGFERAVLEKLLRGEHPALRLLRLQLAGVRVIRREMTGVGFLTELAVAADVPAAPLASQVRIGDVVAEEVEGLQFGLGFVLFVEEGRLAALEGYTFEENWPERMDSWRLEYDPPSRDLSGLDLEAGPPS